MADMKWALCNIHLHASSGLTYAAKPSMAQSSPQDQDTSYAVRVVKFI